MMEKRKKVGKASILIRTLNISLYITGLKHIQKNLSGK